MPALLWCEGFSVTAEGVGLGMPGTGTARPGTLVTPVVGAHGNGGGRLYLVLSYILN